MGYAVIDLETTGFSPSRGDRIIEVGVVLLDDIGAVEQEWTTLVNPQRDVGPTHVHGIHARDVVDAPLFADIAAHLVSLLSGRTLVAHNQAFDVRFLRAELATNGYVLPEAYAALCTMLWSRTAFGAAKLSDVCAGLGIENSSAHAALADARATAAIIGVLLEAAGHSQRWEDDVVKAVFPLASDGPTSIRRAARAVTPLVPMVFVDTAALPLWERVSIPVDVSAPADAVYLDMLTRVLEDGLISTVEYSRLEAIAEVAHLGAERIVALHGEYLEAASAEAIADGVISDDERRELAQIATILDQPVPELLALEAAARPAGDGGRLQRLRVEGASEKQATGAVFTLVPGGRVVFTGTMSRPRDVWARAIADAGFVTAGLAAWWVWSRDENRWGVIVANTSATPFFDVRVNASGNAVAARHPDGGAIALTVVPPGQYFVESLSSRGEQALAAAGHMRPCPGWSVGADVSRPDGLEPLLTAHNYRVDQMTFRDNAGRSWEWTPDEGTRR